MESVNLTLNRVLYITNLLQDACEKKRNQIEKLDTKMYQLFLKEWKQKQKRAMKIHLKEQDELKVLKVTEANNMKEEIEEIALVDSLIEKARNIRLNRKESAENVNNLGHRSLNESSKRKINTCHFESQEKKENSVDTIRNSKKTFPRSKSALPSARLKSTVVPRSKSANVSVVPKDEKTTKHLPIITKAYPKNSAISNKSKQTDLNISEIFNSVVISERDLRDFKKSSYTDDVCDKGTEDTPKGSSSDWIQNSSLNWFPTYGSFYSECKRVSSSRNSFVIHKGSFWYPFLSTKHRSFLLGPRNLSTLDSITKAFELLHKIQEVLVWIDLLSLTGKGTLPGFVFMDKTDMNALRLTQYLKSLYHTTFYKIPLVDPN